MNKPAVAKLGFEALHTLKTLALLQALQSYRGRKDSPDALQYCAEAVEALNDMWSYRRVQAHKPSASLAAEEQLAEWRAAELLGLNALHKPRVPDPDECAARRRVWRETAAEV